MHIVYFIGIGGIGMSALAQIYHQRGYRVYGADTTKSDITERLEKMGMNIYYDHHSDHLPEGVEEVVYTEAIDLTNPEFQKAKSLNIPVKSYFQSLGEISRNFQTVAVSGTHGKTTTTAMLSLILMNAGLDPSVVIGTKMFELGNTNMRMGKSDIFIVEACEYRESFLSLYPDVLIITNCDLDHLDYYRDEKHYQEAFLKLIRKVPANGTIVVDGSTIPKVFLQSLHCQCIDVSTIPEKPIRNVLRVPGDHNVWNARFAYAVAKYFGVPEDVILEHLSAYRGTWRRYDKLVRSDGVIIIDDYGHHPIEIQKTLEAVREEYPDNTVICVFQPHQFSRTKYFLDAFSGSFTHADTVIIPNIYEARDTDTDKKDMDTDILVSHISRHHSDVKNGKGFENTLEYLSEVLKAGDVVITMGAGDIADLAIALKSKS